MATESNPAESPNKAAEPNRPLQQPSFKRFLVALLVFLRERTSLDDDKADPQETIDYVRRGIEFKGTNVWILIFAILVASIGLNMNSAAVIIGAMLISPLMGPIMGIGMGVGINDFELIKKSAKNLGLMVGISVATSTLYFWLSPLSDAQSELLARTTPTIWDVLIALFGGLAGIVAGSRREKSNAIPGVAIATALMPPLCTAGYGLATGNMAYFLGAFYLFTINSVFISFSTLIIVRFLKYPTKAFVDKTKERNVRRWIAISVFIFVLPSLYIAFELVQKSVFEREANVFISEELVFPNTQVIAKTVNAEGEVRRIDVTLFGDQVTEAEIELKREKMRQNKRLNDAELVIRQNGVSSLDREQINQDVRTGIIEELYRKNDENLKAKDAAIEKLEQKVKLLGAGGVELEDVMPTMRAQHPNVINFSINKQVIANPQTGKIDTVLCAYVNFRSYPDYTEKVRLENWLKTITKSDSLQLILQ